MTITELYQWASERKLENASVIIDYICNDDYYNYYNLLSKDDLTVQDGKVVIELDN